MATITIMDPVTRIEGHLKVEIAIDQNRVVDARCSGTLFRGFETILANRNPWDAPVITQRICGVCPISHSQAAVLALENAMGVVSTRNGRLLRNLLLGANFVQSHILHFYLLAALDFARGPQASPWIPQWEVDLRPGLDGVVAHLPRALEARRRAHEMGAIIGGRMPSAHTSIPGGFTEVPTSQQVTNFRTHLDWLLAFIRDTYIPDVLAVADVYPDYRSIGAGCENLLAFGVFDLDDAGAQKLLKRGYVEQKSSNPLAVSIANITEAVTHSWYDSATTGNNPGSGLTRPVYPKTDAYSWLKAPRLAAKVMEVGALARMWVNGDYRQGISVIDRHAARALETLKIAEAMQTWLNELQLGQPVYNGFPRFGTSGSRSGVGLNEAPRGALGHWVRVDAGRIGHYQIITPTCWNASPRDDAGVLGPIEQALIGTPVQDPARPIEALRVIHSFDPCLSCAVHLMKPGREPELLYAGNGR